MSAAVLRKLAGAAMVAAAVLVGAVSAQESVSFIITGSGSSFTATRGDGVGLGSNYTIQGVIEAIQSVVNGADCYLQFGDGETALNIGTAGITFNAGTTPNWGKITLGGKLTGGSIDLTGGASATIDGSFPSTYIYNYSAGTLTILAGSTVGGVNNSSTGSVTITSSTVSSGYSISNSGSGTITINSSTVSSISNSGGGTVTVNGATILGITTGTAIRNTGAGTISVNNATASVTTGTAISNGGAGTITVKAGTFTATSSGTAVGSGSGTITIEGGTFSSATGYAVSITGGTATITDGIFSATGTSNATVYNRGRLFISGGSITANTAPAINCIGTGNTVTISGTASVTSANSSNTQGAIMAEGTVEILGGSVSGGQNAFHAYDGYGRLILGGAPDITGTLVMTVRGNLSVITSGANAFEPQEDRTCAVYHTLPPSALSIDYATPLVIGGEAFSDYFVCGNELYEFYGHEGNLVAVTEGIAVRKVSFNIDGGSGTAPRTILAPDGGRLSVAQRPATNAFIKPDLSNDGKWHTRSGATYTEFVFNADQTGTVVNSDLELFLRWTTPNLYTIVGSGTQYMVNKNGTALTLLATTLAQAITNIKNDANGAGVKIQFGSGADTLDIGTQTVTFDGGTSRTEWGSITLLGAVVGSDCSDVITLNNGASTEIRAKVIYDYSAINCFGITNNSTGTLTIGEGGEIINNTGGSLISNNSSGTVVVDAGGIVTAATVGNTGIRNSSTGIVTVNGGDIRAGTGISNSAAGTVIINSGSIYSTGSSNSTPSTILSSGAGTVIINGGSLLSPNGYAITNSGAAGTVTVNDGDIQSSVRNNGTMTINGGEFLWIVNNSSTMNITSGTFNGTVFNSGTLNITGGTFVSEVTQNSNGELISETVGTALSNTGGTTTIRGGAFTVAVGQPVSVSGGAVNIFGGVLTHSDSGAAVTVSGTGAVVLGKTPNITGRIAGLRSGALSVVTEGADKFVPAAGKQALGFSFYINNLIAVTGGKGLLSSFEIYRSEYDLAESGDNIIVDTKLPAAYVITGDWTSFSATYGGAAVASGTMQAVIDGIRTHAATGDVTIQFGTGGIVEMSGAANIVFQNGTAGAEWGKVTLIGAVTSARSAPGGVINIQNNIALENRAYIANTASTAANGVVIQSGSTGTLTISGGTLSSTNGSAVSNTATTGKIVLAGTPDIRGAIAGYGVGNISLAAGFNAGGNVYTLNLANPSIGAVVIAGGAAHVKGFAFANTGCAPVVSGSDIAVAIADGYYAVSYNADGGAGTVPQTVIVEAGQTIATNPGVGGITKEGLVNDANWYTRSGTAPEYVYSRFVYGASGTPVNGHTELFLKWTVPPYIITVSGSTFTARRNNVVIGSSNTAIQTVINGIKTHANGEDCIIQFGPGTSSLSIGTASIAFDGGESRTDWGVITLTGWLTGTINGSSDAATVVRLLNGASIKVEGTVANTATSGTYRETITNTSSGTITVNDGASITATGSGWTIRSTGVITVNGGTISSSSIAIYQSGSGVITINGGTISGSSSSSATISNSSGVTNINGGKIISTASTGGISISGRTIVLNGDPDITGSITTGSNNFSNVSISVGANFAPSPDRKYTVTASSGSSYNPKIGDVVIAGGASFINNFTSGYAAYAFGTAGDDIVAVAAPGAFVVSFNLDGGTTATAPKSFAVAGGTVVSILASDLPTVTVTKQGYIRDGTGWYTRTGTSEANYVYTLFVTGQQTVTGNIELFVKWQRAYTISFNLNGGEGTTPANMLAPEGVFTDKLHEATTRMVTREGMVWDTYGNNLTAWYTRTGTSEANYVYTLFQPNVSVVSADTELFLKWLKAYTVTFDLNGGVKNPNMDDVFYPITVGEGKQINRCVISGQSLINAVTKDNLINDGKWYTRSGTAPNYTYTLFEFGDCISILPITGDITLYLQWFGAHTVSYSLNGATGTPPASVSVATGGTIASKPSMQQYSWAGYVNDGNWYTRTAAAPYQYTPFAFGAEGTPVTDDVTLYIKWTPIYTVSYNLDGGSGTVPSSVTVDSGATVASRPSVNSAKTGYLTDGNWYTRSASEPYQYTPFAFGAEGTPVTGNTALYLRWFEHVYVITGSGASFSVAIGGPDGLPVGSGVSGQPLQTAIDAIRAHASGSAVRIRFGNGVDVLNIGDASAGFSNPANGTNWGVVTLTGKVTSSNVQPTAGTVAIGGAVSINSEADIANTGGANGTAIFNNSTGTLTIRGGTVAGNAGRAVYNSIGGAVVITASGAVTATSGSGIHNAGGGGLQVTGGTVSSASGRAIHNVGSGSVSISGGVVSSTSGDAVYNNFSGTVTVTGGKLSAPAGYAVYNYTAAFSLGGIPDITGRIGVRAGNFSVIVSGANVFSPAASDYLPLEFDVLERGMVVVKNGKNFLANFGLYGRVNFSLAVSGEDIVMVDEGMDPDAPTYVLTVVSAGTGATASGNRYAVGIQVPVSAGQPPAGQKFKEWTTASAGVTFANRLSSQTTFIMLAGAVTVTAVFVDDPAIQDNADIAAARSLIEAVTFIAEYAANITTIAQARAFVQTIISALTSNQSAPPEAVLGVLSIGVAPAPAAGLNGVDFEIVDGAFTPPVNGTAANQAGTNGSYTFTVKLNKGEGAEVIAGPLTLTINAAPYMPTSVSASDRVVPDISASEEAAVVAPVNAAAAGFTAGPNAVRRGEGVVRVYYHGVTLVTSGSLTVYDATGNVVRKINIRDSAPVSTLSAQSPVRREVGKWDLKDAKGRAASEGTYLLRGVVTTADGKRERVSLLVSVR